MKKIIKVEEIEIDEEAKTKKEKHDGEIVKIINNGIITFEIKNNTEYHYTDSVIKNGKKQREVITVPKKNPQYARVYKEILDNDNNCINRIYSHKEEILEYRNGKLISLESNEGENVTWEYDLHGNLISMKSNDGREVRYIYDENQNCTNIRHFKNNINYRNITSIYDDQHNKIYSETTIIDSLSYASKDIYEAKYDDSNKLIWFKETNNSGSFIRETDVDYYVLEISKSSSKEIIIYSINI